MSSKNPKLSGNVVRSRSKIGIKPLAKIVATGRFLPSVF